MSLTWLHLDFPAVAQFALSSLKILQVVLSPGDQYHLYSTATRALMTAHRRGDARVVEYWSGRPIISISIAPFVYLLAGWMPTDVSFRLPTIRLPVEKPRSIRNKPHDPKPLLQGLTDPFLYNPRKVGAAKVSRSNSYKVTILPDLFIPGKNTRGSKRSIGVCGYIAKSLYL